MRVNFAGNCQSPVTVEVEPDTRTLGLYDLAAWQLDDQWYWLVSLNDVEKAKGHAHDRKGAHAAAEAAALRLSTPAGHG